MRGPISVVVNPAAGRGRALKLLPELRALLAARGIEHVVSVSASPQEPEILARTAAEAGTTAVIAVGGDGLAGMVANGLAGSSTALGVVPAGTGDDFARALGLSRRRPLEGLDLLTDALRPRTVDLGLVSTAERSRYFVAVASAGFDAEVAAVANRIRGGGRIRYVLALLRTLQRFRPLSLDVVVDGARSSLPAMLIAIGNGPTYGGGMRVTPGARIDDGELEACLVRALGRARFLATFPRVYRGTHVRHPKVTMLHGQRFEVTSDRRTPVFADGEAVGVLPATVEVVPGALRVLSR
ncbi:MAG: diacylglycerol kinase family protein [Actinomycetota bacterium]